MTNVVLAPVPASARRTSRATAAPAVLPADTDTGRERPLTEEVFTS